MRARVLQRKGDKGWFDDCYAVEDSEGQIKFVTNLSWEKVGLYYQRQLEESGVSLEEIETVIMPGDPKDWQWLPIEACDDGEAEAFLEGLDRRCHIPRRGAVKVDPRLLGLKV